MNHEPGPGALVPGGTALGDLLYPEPAERRVGAILRWWERRRLAYNLIIGGTGVVSLSAVALIAALPPGGELIGRFVWIPVTAYVVMANLCFLLGPAAEITLEKLWGRKLLPAGPLLFRAGLTFAVGLTLFPVLLVSIGYLFRILGAVF